jgi:hypothetical protein
VRKLLSILTVLLVLTAMLHFSVAQHYCGGRLVASKISLSGALASCGMEDDAKDCGHHSHGDGIESHCCDDVLISYFIDSNYTPAAQSVPGFSQTKIPAPAMLFENPERISFVIFRSWSDVSPPGLLTTSSVDLPSIGVFRI